MFHVVLYQPEIPPNTGNIIRLCANTGSALHLIRPLGFELDDRKLRRAGLDYHEWAALSEYDSLSDFRAQVKPARLWPVSTRGRRQYDAVDYQPGDAFLFGPETRGLPDSVLQECGLDAVLRVPMRESSRSLNLSNSVAVIVYEAWRQQGF
ncbi:MAG: tRNA (uridine(34)/cytosine(34)/5-carboxymethylaminomethyluridine(34)-2'-O)-methyltransferase TrmL [Gammaproteobacteria bacterium]|jgi:tRNA (cytidine/uridine-2'-O-)-methyltransferase|nr:tRNA (uridine(34)/cytosine(34)/5-carboxymethylaminomethyluridine(34)-2'-O)-methyltransferase TrmL [Gammaproteobacteria bacterium]MDH3559344.1 tRNA (uridine(34)/cytosine(34)/5-carboxymethylaminomethyluridine(34)-2'-O)-methyltransferase TrmL [Gammaproteobacteria bacterium]